MSNVPIEVFNIARKWALYDKPQRNQRFIEEALELVQANGITKEECLQLVDYVYGRPAGEPKQEIGGVMTTLATLCFAYEFDMTECGEVELARCWENIDKIRAKQALKPKNSPLPGADAISPRPVYTPMRTSSIHEMQTRPSRLSVADAVVVIIFLVGIAVGIYTLTLRHV